jgi:hypothetical protein
MRAASGSAPPRGPPQTAVRQPNAHAAAAAQIIHGGARAISYLLVALIRRAHQCRLCVDALPLQLERDDLADW